MSMGAARIGWLIRTYLDVFDARRSCRELALRIGFSRAESAELEIVASELGWNIIKHAGAGQIELSVIEDEVGRGLEIRAHDKGGPLHGFEDAIRDGWGNGELIDPLCLIGRGGLGVGLGAVIRLTDTLTYQPSTNGKCFVAVRYLAPDGVRFRRRRKVGAPSGR